jgi:hypothetical protein
MKVLKNDWQQYIIYLKFTNNRMVCVRQYSTAFLQNADTDNYTDWVYFSQKKYGSVRDAIKASEKYMKNNL